MAQLTEFIINHPYLWATFAVVLAMLALNEYQHRSRRYRDVTPSEATQLLNHSNAILVDLREPKEYEDGHIVNAIHIPMNKLDDQLKKLEKHKKKPVIAYCRTGNRSGTACSRLQKHGFEAVYHLRGGITAWQRDKLPLVKD